MTWPSYTHTYLFSLFSAERFILSLTWQQGRGVIQHPFFRGVCEALQHILTPESCAVLGLYPNGRSRWGLAGAKYRILGFKGLPGTKST